MNKIRQRSLICQLGLNNRIICLNHESLNKRQEGLQVLVCKRMQCFFLFCPGATCFVKRERRV